MFESLLGTSTDINVFGWIFAIYLGLVVSGVGIPIPEEVPLLFLSVLYYQDRISSPVWLAIAIVAISLADYCLYSIGRYLGFKIFKHPFFKGKFNENTMHKVSHYIHRYGYKVIILGRLLLGVRSAIFLSSGILRMPQNKFIMYDLIASCISVSLFMFVSTQLLKKFDGELELVQGFIKQYQGIFTLLALFLVALIVAGIFLLKYLKSKKKQVSNKPQ